MDAKLIQNKKGKIDIAIRFYDKDGILRRRRLSLQKVATAGIVAIGLTIAGTMGIIHLASNSMKMPNPDEFSDNFDNSEKEIQEQLMDYYIALDEYNKVKQEKNTNENEIIEKRVDLVEEIKKLQTTADSLMQRKVKEALGINDLEIKVIVERSIVDKNTTPIDTITVIKGEETLYSTNEIPVEFQIVLNKQEAIKVYEGSGKNQVWEKAISKFVDEGNSLYRTILEISEKEYVIKDGKIKSIEDNKTM